MFPSIHNSAPSKIDILAVFVMIASAVSLWRLVDTADGKVVGRPQGRPVRVAILRGPQTSTQSLDLLSTLLNQSHRFECQVLSADEIRNGMLHQDVLVVPGGSATSYYDDLCEEGRAAIRQYVAAGGGFVGICAGAFLATCDEDRGLGLLNAKSLSGSHPVAGWGSVDVAARSAGVVQVRFTQQGKARLRQSMDVTSVVYSGGPILLPHDAKSLPPFESLAVFETETCSYDFQRGTMIRTPAIVTARFGSGRVIVFSPHPEMTEDLDSLLTAAVLSAASAEVSSAPVAECR